jgi:hypothetical protein
MARINLRHRHDLLPTGATRGLARAAELAEAKKAPARIETQGSNFDLYRSNPISSSQIEDRAFSLSRRCCNIAFEGSE